ncbi:MAG TPA: hypothetical protein VHA77_05815 [Xanthobacteraceae bacterium]|jgi:hypothetical protein|nr:hypothetical protein [Xanthobacteraceae bacterium]
MFKKSSRIGATVFAASLSALCVVSVASAQQGQTARLRGTIEKLDGNVLTIKSRDGAEQRVVLAKDAQVVGVAKASLSDVKEGSYVGSAAMPQADGTQKALEVHIFAPSQRGTGEGHRPFTIPNSTMTNGTVGQTVTGVDGQTLTVKYSGGEKKIVVPPGTPIVQYQVGDRSELKPGASVSIANAVKKPDGSFEAARVNVGRDGVVPR